MTRRKSSPWGEIGKEFIWLFFVPCDANFTYLYISYIPLRSVRDTFSIHVLISVPLSSQNLHHWANGFMKFMIILCHYNITKTKTWYTNWFWWVCFSAYLFEIGKVDSRWLKDLWSNGFDSLQDTGHEGNWIAFDIDELVFSLEDVDPIVHIQGHPLPVWWQLETRPHPFLTARTFLDKSMNSKWTKLIKQNNVSIICVNIDT